jgi:cytidylate kinase
MKNNVIVTIARQLGSGGTFIGKQVAERLAIKYIDREILQQVAAILHESENNLSDREERLSTFWERMARAFCYGIPEAGYVPPPLRPIPDEELFAVERMIIRKITEDCSAVLVGRAGFHILRDKPNIVNVFIHAPKEFRVRRIMELYNIPDTGQALEMIEDSDRQRMEFVKTMTGQDWTDALNYHLSIDSSIAGFSTGVEMVLPLAEKIRNVPGKKA